MHDNKKPLSLTFVEYEAGDLFGFILAWFTLLPIIYAVQVATVIALRRDLFTIFYLIGAFLNESINYILKNTIQQPRPVLSKKTGNFTKYGMPSNHAQTMFYFMSFIGLLVVFRLNLGNTILKSSILKPLVVFVSFLTATIVAYSRVYLEYHSTDQVVLGAIVGITVGTAWFYLVHTKFSQYFQTICSWRLSEFFMVRDYTHIPNILSFQYTCERNEAGVSQGMQFVKTLSTSRELSETELDNLIRTKQVNDFVRANDMQQYDLPRDNLSILKAYKHDKTWDNIVLYAARCENFNLLQLLFKYEFDFNYTNKDGKNALHEACQTANSDCVEFLVKTAQINVNSLRKGDWTPLMLACTKSNLIVIKFLIEHNSKADIRNKDGWNAFHIAVREGHCDIIKYLLEVDSSLLNTRTNNLRTALHIAALHGHKDVMEILLENEILKLSIDVKDTCGVTPLMDALAVDNVEIARLLVEKYKANINEKDSIHNTCVHVSAQSGALNSLKYLIEDLGFDLNNCLNGYNMTPLHSACKNNQIVVVEYLVQKQIPINRLDINGRTACDIAKNGRYTKCIELLQTN